MITFLISLAALVLGYIFYGRFVEKVFGPDNRETPAISKADKVDFITLPTRKVFMIQFLNIAGTGPIFGAILGAKYGPAAYLWIVLGCIFAGAVHDYMCGMLSMRNGGAGLPEIIGKYLGGRTKTIMLVFSTLVLVLVGVVYVYSPAVILKGVWGNELLWIIVIFLYYIVATMLPINKIIGKIYPFFAVSFIFMALALLICLLIKMPQLPEIWDGLGNLAIKTGHDSEPLMPCLFITIACGAISGFHATQSPLMARCMKSERNGRPIFYGAMITEGIVALIWATVASYFFYGSPAPGYQIIEAARGTGYATTAPAVVKIICEHWLGLIGGVFALLGVVAAPITSGDTAFRSARLIIAEFFHFDQNPIKKRLLVCIPLFSASFVVLFWQIQNPNGFDVVWRYFGWANQTLATFMLWAITVYLVQNKKPFIITLVPALFMTTICSMFLVVSKSAFNFGITLAYVVGAVVLVIALVWFFSWYRKSTVNN